VPDLLAMRHEMPRNAGHFLLRDVSQKLQSFQRVRNFPKSRNLHADNSNVMQFA
jgi:hypothetical protein